MHRRGALSLLVLLALTACSKKSAPTTESVASARAARQAPGALIAPAPVGSGAGSPLAGPVGVDKDGFPTQYVDRAVLRGMLLRREFAELTSVFERFQADFESDPTRETWPMDAADAFNSAETAIEAGLDAWVAATPASFAPYLARGTHWTSVGYARRGTRWAKDTPPEDFAAMREAFDRARPDLEKSLSLRPKLVAAQRPLIQIGRAESDDAGTERAIAGALSACPSCFRVRVTYMTNSTPRWGGSYSKMAAFAKKSASAGPKMHLLPGFIDLDKANVLEHDKRYEEALAAIERACALGEHWGFLHERGQHQLHHGDIGKALSDLERAAAMKPGEPNVLADRARAFATVRRYEDAGRDLRAVFLVAPTNRDAKKLLSNVLDGLLYEAVQHRNAGRREDAIRVLDLAAELAPDDQRITRQRAWTILGDAGSADAIGEREAAVLRDPDSFDARRELDYALARQRRFDRVIEVWTEYLAAHPDDGRAYLERGGAYFNLRKLAEAKADATKACELGVSEACARAKQLP